MKIYPGQVKTILSEVVGHMQDSDWYQDQTTNQTKGVISDFVRGGRVRNVSLKNDKNESISMFYNPYDMLQNLNGAQQFGTQNIESLHAGGYIAKKSHLFY